MAPTTLSQIAVRVVAIYVIAQGIMYLPSIHSVMLYGSNRTGVDESAFSLIIAAIFGPMIVGLVLWAAAPTISKWIVVGAEEDAAEQAPFTLRQLQAVVISTAGLVIVFLSLPGFISLLFQAFGGAYEFEGEKIFNAAIVVNLLASGLKVAFGILLILGVRFWGRLLNRFKEFGLEEKTSNKKTQPTANASAD